MADTFFTRVRTETPTRIWVNNPTVDEVALALGQGVVGCTTNPAYGASLLRRAPNEILAVIAECADRSDDDAVVADLVQEAVVARIVDLFGPLHRTSGGTLGLVSIQGSPEADHDAEAIVAGARAGRLLGPNSVPKLPATSPGLDAFETLVGEGCPTIITEVFSLAQLVETNERYLRVTDRTGFSPPFYVSPITGIFGDYLKSIAGIGRTDVTAGDMELAGVALAHACFRLVSDRSYPSLLLCGGARTDSDLTSLIGMPVHITINWSTIEEASDRSPTSSTWEAGPIDADAMTRLEAAFPDFGRAMRVDGLQLDEFASFGPVRHFHSVFANGWQKVREAIVAERTKVPT